jgi:hypothetical protein
MLDVVTPTCRAISAIDNPNSFTPRFAILARTVEGDVVQIFHFISFCYRDPPFKKYQTNYWLRLQNKKAHSNFWNRLLKGFSSAGHPCAPSRVAISATINPLGLAFIDRMMRHCRTD